MVWSYAILRGLRFKNRISMSNLKLFESKQVRSVFSEQEEKCADLTEQIINLTKITNI